MFLHPAMKAFDAPPREECTAERPVSNTPQAALTLLNDPTYVEAARVFAARLLRSGSGSDEERIAEGFRLATSREIRGEERGLLRQLLATQREEYRRDSKAADALLAIGLTPIPKGMDRAELAAWTAVTRTLLNLHETTTRN